VEKTRSNFEYPVPYVVWKKANKGEISQDDPLEKVYGKTRRQTLGAEPVDRENRTSPWLTATEGVLQGLAKVRGRSGYIARKGVYCPTNAVYWLTEARPAGGNRILITNLADTGKKRVPRVTQSVEKDFVYSLVRGKDVSRWRWLSEMKVILPQDPEDPAKAMPESELKKRFPNTYSYFKQFESELRGCALLEQFFDPNVDPFYSSYNVGRYTFQRYKVVWKEIAAEVQAAVIDSEESIVIPDHKLVMVAFDSAERAHLLCSIINSSPIRMLVRAYGIQTSISGHVCQDANLPAYSSKDVPQEALIALSKQCHAAAANGDMKLVASIEARIDEGAVKAWGIMSDELEAIRDALAEAESKRRMAIAPDEDE
jgi:hypothetical protein